MASPFAELGSALGWREELQVLVISVYIDESGLHDQTTGRLRRLALAGCLARDIDWLRFELEWSPVLKAYSVTPPFHMVDFEACQGQFLGWSIERHRSFLNDLLACFDPHVGAIFGASTIIGEAEPLRETYLKNIKRTLRNAFSEGTFWATPGEPIALVFAKHPQVAPGRVEQYVTAIEQEFPNLGTITFGDPRELVPLQAADLVAYEVARFIPHQDIRRMRYPMARIWGTTRMSVGPEEDYRWTP